MLNKLLFLILGGSIGTFLRYGVSLWVSPYSYQAFPLGTFLVNMIGSFLIGLSYAYFADNTMPTAWRLFLFVGLFGSFTTFSSFAYEGMDMLATGKFKMALIYLLSSNILGLFLVFLGMYLGGKIN